MSVYSAYVQHFTQQYWWCRSEMQSVLSQRAGQRVRRPERESAHAGGASDAEPHPHRTRQRASGQANAQGPRVVGPKSDHDNHPGNTGSALILVFATASTCRSMRLLFRSSGRLRINLTSTKRPIGTGGRRRVEGGGGEAKAG